ncbi:MAG: hypothetical protein ABI120_12105 [Gemmatimonadaceae bacterium]
MALSASACSDGPKDFVTGEPKADTTLTDPRDSFIPPTATATTTPRRVTASSYPIDYYISVPAGWPGKRAWPIVVNITGSGRDWEPAAQGFAAARNASDAPFIVITPVVLTNSGDGPIPRNHPAYSYPSSTWDLIDQQGRCAFDMAGIKAAIEDVRNKYSGQTKAFLTGFSGGGHTAWANVLLRPQLLRAAALVGGNFNGRCVTKETFTPQAISSAPERVLFPVRSFIGADDPGLASGIVQQSLALNLAILNGYGNTSTEVVPGFAHDPMPKKILSYFMSLLGPTER